MRSRGFSLIELMVTVAVLAVLLTIGLPSFQSSMRSNRVATGTNELLASLALARSEAIRNPGGAGICASEDGESCGGTWDDGWLVWLDSDANGEPGAGERILRHVEGSGHIEVVEEGLAGGAEAHKVLFDTRGLAGTDARRFVLEAVDCRSGQSLVRTLSLSVVGQVTVARGTCP